jgi:O-antigen ligase
MPPSSGSIATAGRIGVTYLFNSAGAAIALGWPDKQKPVDARVLPVDSLIPTIGAAAILVWAGIVLARGGLVGTALLLLLAGSCFGHPFFRVSAAGVPLTVDRLLLIVLLAQYAVYRRWGVIELKPPRKADYLLAALLLVLVVGTLVHDFRADHWQPLAYLVFFYLMPAALYWMARQAEWTARTAWFAFAALACFGVYLCLTAVAETQGAWAFVYPKYIASPMFGEFYGHGRGPFLNPAATGLMQTLGMCAALVFWPRVRRWGRLMLLLLLGVYVIGIYSTLTLSAWLGAGAALLVVLALSTPRGWRARVVTVTLVASAITVGLSWRHLAALAQVKKLVATATAETAKLRAGSSVEDWQMFLDRPILGCGLGQYPREMPAYLSKRTTQSLPQKAQQDAPRNVFLGLLTETGLLGAGLFCALLASWTLTAWRLWRAASAPLWVRQMGLLFIAWMAAYLAEAMFHDLSIVPMVNMFLFFLGGAVMGLTAFLAIPQTRDSGLVWLSEEEPEPVAY